MKNKKLNFIFFGTPDIASETLEILKENGYIPSLIITSPDKPVGRGLHLTPSPVSIWADENKIICLKPEKIDDEFIKKLIPHVGHVGKTKSHMSDMWVDLSIVVAYGKILPEKLINLPKLGTINIHYSLLPKYRGASPLEACLLNGDKKTGVSIQQMVFKLDSGPILIEKKILIKIEDTKKKLQEKLIKLGAETLSEIIPEIIRKETTPKIQDESKVIFCKKIKKEDGLLDLNGNDKENYNKYRAFIGWPGTFFFKEEKRIKITKAKYENNQFVIEKVIPESKKEIPYNILK